MAINVLWFDDEWLDLKHIVRDAKRADLIFHGVDNAKDGIEQLKNNPDFFDAIVLDGKFLNTADQRHLKATDEIKDNAFKEVLQQLIFLQGRGIYFPCFVLSGQYSFTKERSTAVEDYKKILTLETDVFSKGGANPNTCNGLFPAIHQAVLNRHTTRIKLKFASFLELCEDQHLGEKQYERLLKLLLFLENEKIYDEDKFNLLRKVFESVLHSCYHKGMIDVRCRTERGLNVTWSLHYLKGDKTTIKDGKNTLLISGPQRMPSLIADMAFFIKDITNAGSHNEDQLGEDEMAKLSQLLDHTRQSYIIKSVIYKLLDILAWYKNLVNQNPDVDFNRSQVQEHEYDTRGGNWVTGRISKEGPESYKFIPEGQDRFIRIKRNIVEENGLLDGEQIEALIAQQDVIRDIR